MFQFCGKIVERWWQVILIFWLALFVGSVFVLQGWINKFDWIGWKVPRWLEVARSGEFDYLPKEMQSLVGEKLLATAFPSDLLKSSVVIVVRRESRPLVKPGERTAWPQSDEEFIEETLKPRLEAIRDEKGSFISDVKTFTDPLMGRLLVNQDERASLVIVALTTEFLEWRNLPTVEKIEKLLKELVDRKEVPPGLDLAMSGTATVGRDMLVAGQDSAKSTERATIYLVIILLVLIYRAPILAVIPLLTVVVAVEASLALELLLTQVPFLNFHIFRGMNVYITVVAYGAGVDYCLFLIARYKEELDAGAGLKQGISVTMGHVGAALTASAGTVICGIGMMIFAQFGKFREAGIGISLALCIVLCASLTLTPALLRWAGRWAFWPFAGMEQISAAGGRISPTRIIHRLVERNRVQVFWEDIGKLLLRHPGKILVGCFAAMVPFAVIGLWFYDHLSYGLLTELKPNKQSVIGAEAVQKHFPPGYAGPLTILLRNDEIDFGDAETGIPALDTLINRLEPRLTDLGIYDIRYVSQPLGFHGRAILDALPGVRRMASLAKARSYYVSTTGNLDGHVTRIDVVFNNDPFSREGIRQLNAVEAAVKESLPVELRDGSRTDVLFVGATASIRDLKTVTDHDQVKIDFLVLAGVFAILVLLLRKIAVPLYLVLSVFFSYFVTLGVSIAVFYAMDPANFAGLDWKVPMFLFTILIAIGEDYNIFLMTRIEEEQQQHGPVEGVRIAMLRTGSIISSCGIIMAGTFCSLMFGELVGMQQLGFALAFGVLLDTFVVRPILVPAYLILLYSGRFGALGGWLGQKKISRQPAKVPHTFNARVDA